MINDLDYQISIAVGNYNEEFFPFKAIASESKSYINIYNEGQLVRNVPIKSFLEQYFYIGRKKTRERL